MSTASSTGSSQPPSASQTASQTGAPRGHAGADSAPHWLLLVPRHPDGVTENFAQAIAQALTQCGRRVHLLMMGPQLAEQLVAAQPLTAEAALSIGATPLSIQVGDLPLHQVLSCPFFYYVLDTLIYDLRLAGVRRFLSDARDQPRLVPLLAERSTLQAWGSGPGALLPAQSAYMPFAAFPDPGPALPVPAQARLLVFGGLGTELAAQGMAAGLVDTLAAHNALGLESTHLQRLAEHLLAPDARGGVALDLFEQLGLAPEAALQPAVQALVCAADSWLKRWRRVQAINSLRGLPVDFVGPGWDQVYGQVADFRFLGALPHRQLARLTRLYRGLLNFDPNWEHGAHDRLYTALSMGVPVLSHANTAHRECRVPPGVLLPFAPNAPALAPLAERLIAHDATGFAAQGVDWHSRIASLMAHPALQPERVAH
jgi:hypothetical protein